METFLKNRIIAKNSDYTHVSMDQPYEKYYIETCDREMFYKLLSKEKFGKFSLLEKPRETRYIRFDLDMLLKEAPNRIFGTELKSLCEIIRETIRPYSKFIDKCPIYILKRNHVVSYQNKYKLGFHLQIPQFKTNQDYFSKIICDDLIKNKKIKTLLNQMEIINSADQIFDKSVYKNNWLTYGCDKKNNNENAYKMWGFQENDENIVFPNSDEYNSENDILTYASQLSISNPLMKHSNNNIVKLPKELENTIENQIREKELKPKIITKIYSENNIVDLDFVKELVSILNPKRAYDYNTWWEIGQILLNINENLFNVFDKFSKIAEDKYDGVEQLWEAGSKTNKTFGSLRYLAKKDNPEKYDKICDKYKKWDMKHILPKWDDDSIAKDFAKRYFAKFIFQDEKMYYFDEIYWKIDEKNRKLKIFIANEYYNELTKINHNKWIEDTKKPDADIDACDNFKDNYNKCIASLKKNTNRKNLAECIEGYIINNEIKFDTNPYLFVFQNKIWDLTKNDFVNPNPLDYMSMSTGYDYVEDYHLENKMKIIDTIINQILPDKDVKECLLKILASGMSGRRLPKITILNGCGRNGKGVLMKLLQSAIGNYFVKVDNSVLTEKKGKSGSANPAKAKLDKARVASFVEPDDTDRLNCSSLKEITGESTLDGARALYSQKDDIDLFCTLLIECNKKPLLNETTDAIIQRIMDILFPNTFTDDEDSIDEENGYYRINLNYDTNDWRDDNKIAMFHYLQPYFMKLYNDDFNLNTPQSIKDRNDKYLSDSDDIYSWFKSLLDEDCEGNEYIKKTDNKEDFIKISDIYNMFKNSTYFTNLNKKEKRDLNKNKFIENIIKIKQFKKVYKKQQQQKIGGKNETRRNILTTFTLVSKNLLNNYEDEL